jgi:hypothetical protein
MCTHLYKIPGTFCDYEVSFHQDIPIHPSTGHCIFHSTDAEWKVGNNFNDWFRSLVIDLDSKGEIELYDIQLVGEIVPEEYVEIFDGAKKGICLTKFIIKNSITLYDCIFEDNVLLHRGCFKGIVAVKNCEFHKGFLVDSCSFREDTNVEAGCVFRKEFYVTNDSLFLGHVSIHNNVFEGEISIQDSYFDMPLHVIKNQFTTSEFHVTFSSTFMYGVSFDKNNYSGVLSFYESELYETSSVEGNDGTPWINLSDTQLHGVLRFQGTERNLLFQTKAEIKLSDIIFEPGGLLIFDYCNMLNLSQEFLLKLRELEKEDKVLILDTCKLYSFHTVLEYETVNVNDAVFTDFHNLVSRYFLKEKSISIDLTFLRSVNDRTFKVYYSSIDDLTERFEDIFNETLLKINEEESIDPELEIQRRAIMMRLGYQVQVGKLKVDAEHNLRSNFDKLQIRPIHLVVKKMLIESGGSLQIENASVNSITVDKLIIKNLSELNDPIQFRLDETQLEQIKAEIISIGNLSKITENVADILKNQKNQKDKESDLKEFLLRHGVSVIGSMTGAALFTFLKMVFPI